FIAPFFGSVVGIILKIRRGAEVIPYGPFLSLGSIVALFWGDRILAYLGFIR
ncbi:MAG: prepilin peptidase, partial [Candidatus Omnitrophica bacterium]|nr:prepilin peptidase [Candidatus Omnitrophota bacterium]